MRWQYDRHFEDLHLPLAGSSFASEGPPAKEENQLSRVVYYLWMQRYRFGFRYEATEYFATF